VSVTADTSHPYCAEVNASIPRGVKLDGGRVSADLDNLGNLILSAILAVSVRACWSMDRCSLLLAVWSARPFYGDPCMAWLTAQFASFKRLLALLPDGRDLIRRSFDRLSAKSIPWRRRCW